eukprot:TRINITY_DN69647_c0_g1_i1.p1 TRINITY_DN69647_c0_g1~~TRINITY_DN69647_c0_g1_i1.p1  ORF type:complete len:776 (-),score=91.63 TRINITY_DN69647_c0_g1_i1:130-2190(-)
MVNVAEGRLRILWIGRRRECPVHPSVRGVRCVTGEGVCDVGLAEHLEGVSGKKTSEAPKDVGAPPPLQTKGRTVAEAMLGMVAAIGFLFGATVLELQAMDNGSGKLVAMYQRLGLHICRSEVGEAVWMQAPSRWCSRLAPLRWLEALKPDDFNCQDWVRSRLVFYRDEKRLFDRARSPWEFDVSWPYKARLRARLLFDHQDVKQGLEQHSRFNLDAKVSVGNIEAVSLKANIWVSLRKLRITWLGGANGTPVDKRVRGKRMHVVAKSSETGDEVRVTTAMALLGAITSIAKWLGVNVVVFRVSGEHSDRLDSYLRCHGFQSMGPTGGDSSDVLEASCEEVTRRCCPTAWRDELPADGDVLSQFADTVISNTEATISTPAAPATPMELAQGAAAQASLPSAEDTQRHDQGSKLSLPLRGNSLEQGRATYDLSPQCELGERFKSRGKANDADQQAWRPVLRGRGVAPTAVTSDEKVVGTAARRRASPKLCLNDSAVTETAGDECMRIVSHSRSPASGLLVSGKFHTGDSDSRMSGRFARPHSGWVAPNPTQTVDRCRSIVSPAASRAIDRSLSPAHVDELLGPPARWRSVSASSVSTIRSTTEPSAYRSDLPVRPLMAQEILVPSVAPRQLKAKGVDVEVRQPTRPWRDLKPSRGRAAARPKARDALGAMGPLLELLQKRRRDFYADQ